MVAARCPTSVYPVRMMVAREEHSFTQHGHGTTMPLCRFCARSDCNNSSDIEGSRQNAPATDSSVRAATPRVWLLASRLSEANNPNRIASRYHSSSAGASSGTVRNASVRPDTNCTAVVLLFRSMYAIDMNCAVPFDDVVRCYPLLH